jgi:VWFA-related protein
LGIGADPAEQSAYNAFNNEAVVETKIALGEQFDQKYPKSRYQEQVDTSLSYLYFNKGDYPKFYAACDRVLAKNSKSIPVLELLGWVIPRDYNVVDPAAAAKLDEAEKYEKRALAEIAAMKKPRQVTRSDFENSKASLEWRAHSSLGTIYFRHRDFADSAAELEIAVKQQGPEADPTDLYVLGVDLENLGHMNQAADEFAQCSVTTAGIQEQCQKAYEAASHAAVESVEERAYDAFYNAPNAKAQIQLGEKFDQTYPSSAYTETVDSALLSLYEADQDWTKFYFVANTVLSKDPDNVPVLALVGWVIPRHYDTTAPDGPDRLADAEKYEKHALDLIATMQKPSDLTEDQFDQAKVNATLRAHDGLGVTYFRLGDYADAAAELQLATVNKSQAGAWDFYILGTTLHKLKRDREAIDAFSDCVAVSGDLQAQCKRDVAALSTPLNAPQPSVQLTAVASKTSDSLVFMPSSSDIPPSTPQETAPEIRTETVIVPVRVVVRDNRGRAVSSLQKEDFKLYQDDKLQQVASFAGISSASPTETNTAAPSGSVTSATPGGAAVANSGIVPVARPQRYIGLFFDDMHGDNAGLREAANAAEGYLSSVQPTDRIAIMTSSGQGDVNFTDDRDKLHAALEKVHLRVSPGFGCPDMDNLEAETIAHGGTQLPAVEDVLHCAYGGDENLRGLAVQTVASDVKAADFQAGVGTEALLRRLDASVGRLSAMPGERHLILISTGFMAPGQALAGAIDRAIRFNIVVGALNLKGVAVTGAAADARAAAAMGTLAMDETVELENEQEPLTDIAGSTGGVAIHGSNGFAAGLAELASPPEYYYLLSYSPQGLTRDGKYHQLKVTLAHRSGDSVEARRGFYAPSSVETPEEAATREIEDAVFSDEELHDLPVTMETSLASAAAGSSKLNVVADLGVANLRFVKAERANKEEVIVAAALFDTDGNYVAGTKKTVTMRYDDVSLAKVRMNGAKIDFDFDVKAGTYTLRLVARDSNDGHISAENANVSVPN